jgi:hypothetical protein
VIGETIFDVRSSQSMKNLQEVAKCKELTSWLKKLTVSCLSLPRNEDDLRRSKIGLFCDETGENELTRIKNDDQSWFPSVWKSCSTMDDARGLDGLSQLLSSCLKAFQNLAHLHYYYDEEHTPGRLMSLVRRSRDVEGLVFDWRLGHPAVQFGQELLLAAMADAGTRPKTLELAADVYRPMRHQYSTVYAPTVPFPPEFSQTTTPIVKNQPSEWRSSRGPPYLIQQAQFSKSVFPVLHTLVLEGWKRSGRPQTASSPLPESFDFPTLTSITFAHSRLDDAELLPFLRFFQGSLRRVKFEELEACFESFVHVLQGLASFDLEELVIQDRKECRVNDGLSLANSVLSELLRAAAQNVVVETPWGTALTKLAELE